MSHEWDLKEGPTIQETSERKGTSNQRTSGNARGVISGPLKYVWPHESHGEANCWCRKDQQFGNDRHLLLPGKSPVPTERQQGKLAERPTAEDNERGNIHGCFTRRVSIFLQEVPAAATPQHPSPALMFCCLCLQNSARMCDIRWANHL